MAGRPRRTRIYGANYNIGESYYKSALDNLDRKQRGSSILNADSDSFGLTKPNRNIDDLLKGNSIFQKGIRDEESPLFDYTPIKEPIMKSLPVFDDEPEQEIRSSLRRMGEIKRAASPCFLDDFTALKERNNRNSVETSRFLKPKPMYDFDDLNDELSLAKSDIFKSTATATSASSRANATKERLANIEFEMSERLDKQVQREKRSANLKKILNETGIETKVVKKVTF